MQNLENIHEAANAHAEVKPAKLSAIQQVQLINWENELDNLFAVNNTKKIADITKKITLLKWKGIIK